MKRIKPKWLLGATLVAAIVMSCSLMVQAAAPSFTGSGITSPTGASPAYRQAGATFTTTFTYASDPDTIPRWTKALVQLYDGDTLVKEIEETIPSARLDGGGADPSYTGTASIGMIIPPPPLPGLDEGLYDVKVFLSNSDGGGWSVSDTELGAVIIDETPPSAPGAPSTTTPTTDTTPDWTWTAATDPTILGGATPGSGVKGYWVRIGTTSGDDDVLTDTWVGNVLNWTTSLALTPDDTYYLSVCAEDNVGNLGDWATGSVLVDTTNPLAPTGLTATTPTNDTTPEVSWTAATDPGYPDSGSGIAGYNVQIGTSSGGSDVKVATWVGDITTFDDAAWAALGVTLAPDGTYYFQVQSVDNVGWTSGWAEVAIVVDTARPVLANGLPNVYGTDDTPTISADFTDVGVGLDASETTLTLTYDGTPTVITTGFTGVPGYADGLPATNIQYTPGSSLADGAYTVDMVAYDLAGNKTTPDPTLQWTFNIDTTPPTDPGSPTAGNLGDDGKWYINTLRPTFSWTASEDPDAPDGSPGSGLHHYWFQFGTEASKPGTGTDAWASATVEEPSVLATLGVTVQQWTPSTDLPLAADVDYSARVKAFDVLGNASSWVDPLIVYDPDPPTTPGAPVPEDDPTNDATPLWSWEGSTDDISGVDLYHIQIRRAGSADWDVLDTFLDIPDALAPGDEEWEQGLPLESGDYEIRVRAMDVAGNYSDWSEPGTVTVDVDPPAVPDMPQTASPTNDTTPTWTWDAVADADHYEVYLDGVHMTDDAVETDTEYTPTVALGEGQHYLQVSAVDALGNESALSEAGYVVIDTTDPQAPEMTALPEYTNADEIVFTWSAVTDAVSYDFRYSLDGGVVWTPVLGLTVPTYTVDISGAVDGAEILGSVIAYDEAGNDSPESDPASTIVDRTGPVVNAVSPLAPVTTNDPTPAWEWSGDDGTGCGVKGYWVTLDDEAAIWTTATSFTPAAALVDGDHILKVVGVDELDNEGTETVFATVSIDTTPPAIPGMPWTTSPTNNTTPHWYWTQVSGATRYNVYLDNVLMVTVLQPGDPGALVDWITAPALSEGEHYLQVSSLDELGNESALSEAGYVTIDTTGPVAPVVTLVTPSPTNEEQTWSWTRPADAVRYDFGESADGITPPAVFTDVGNVDTYKTDFAPDGTHYVMVRGYDALGNVGAWSAAASVVIDTTPPGVPTDLAVVSPTTDKTPTWGWSAMAGAAGYEIRLDGAIIEDVADAIVYTHSEELGDGSHTLEVRSYDDLGNKSAWCAPVTVVVDTAIPDAPAIAALAPGYNTSPIALDWNDVVDGTNTISYVLEYADNAGFSAATSVPLGVSECSFDAATEGEGEWWFRVKTISTVNVGETKESGWSAVVSTIYDITPPGTPILTLETPDPTNESPQRWSWTAPEGAVGYDVNVDGAGWVDIGDACTYQTTFATTGNYTFAVRAYDWLGNTGTATTGDVDVDVTPPDVPTNLRATTPTNNNTPTWEWDESTGDVDTYEVSLDGAAPVNVGDALGYEAPAPLTDGLHTLAVRALDALGNASGWVEKDVEVDTTVATPTAPVATVDPTNAIPIWTWVAVTDPNGPVTYNVYLDGTLAVSGLDATIWSPATIPADGPHYLQIEAVDDLGNVSAISERGYVVVDTGAPAAPEMQPLPEYTDEDSVTFIWSAVTDAVSYDFRYSLDGGATWTSVTGLTVQTNTVDISDADDGDVIQGKVVAYDAGGNASAESNVASTIVDRTPPVVAFSSTPPALTNNNELTWTWTVTEDGSGIAGYLVQLDAGGQTWVTETEFTAVVADGPHVLKVTPQDNVGLVGDTITSGVVVVDTEKPAAPNAPVAEESPTRDTTPKWTWNAVTDDHGPVTYDVYLDGEFQVSTTDTEWAVPDDDPLGDGEHYLQVTAEDGLGNTSAMSERGYVVVDTEAPAAPQMQPLPEYTNQDSVTFIWSAVTDAVRYRFSYSPDGGDTWYIAIPDLTVQTHTVDISDAEDGDVIQGKVVAYDAAGNASDESNVVSTIVDRTPPATPAKPAPDGGATKDPTPTWTWAAVDDAAGYAVMLDNVELNIGYAGESPEFTVPDLLALTDGLHTLRVKAYDALGNESGWSPPATVLVDTTPPTITFISPVLGDKVNITTGSTIVAELSDSGAGLDNSEVKLVIDAGPEVAPTAIVGGTLYYVVDLPYVDRQSHIHWVTIKARDLVGNERAASVSFELDIYREGFGFGRFRFPEDD